LKVPGIEIVRMTDCSLLMMQTDLGGIPTDWGFDWRSTHRVEMIGISVN
jgi:hypothetical protein